MVNKRSLLVLVGCFVVHGSKVVGQSRVHAHGQAAWSLYSNGEPTPDTTSAWRYYPLHVGNVWEHQRDDGFEIVDIRREIVKDTTISDTTYVIQEDAYFRNGSMTSFQRYVIRYDTLTASVLFRTPQDTERPFSITPCRFDTDFDVQIVCHPTIEHSVSGDTDGTLEFNDGSTVEGVTIKSFTSEFYTIPYAADFGFLGWIDFEGGGIESLQYAKVDGKEFGVAMLPTSNEPHELASQGTYIQLWPNPATDHITIATPRTCQFGDININLIDVRGRLVREVHGHRNDRNTISTQNVRPGVYYARFTCSFNGDSNSVSGPITILP